MALISIENVRLEYPSRRGQKVLALDGVSASIERGEFVSIIGPSGCGKSTLLQIIEGLLAPTAGAVKVNGKPVTAPGPERAMVFQDFALFPWRSVAENVAFGLKMAGVAHAERLARAEKYVRMVGLEGFEKAYPYQLSGGMRQRVGVARALCTDPEILLMDEPLGAIDAQTSEIMQEELLRICLDSGKTIIYVTHSLDEAVFMSKRVLVLSARPGRLKADVTIDLPYPRTLDIPPPQPYAERKQVLWLHLMDQVVGSYRRGDV